MGHEASDFLRAEHRQVENHLDHLLDALKHLSPERVGDVSRSSREIHRLVSAHMEVEEQVFYPALQSMVEDLIENLLKQHDQIRESDRYLEELLSGFPELPTARDTEELYRLGIEFHDAVQVHIVDEEEQLLKRVDEHLSSEQQRSLLAAMQRGSPEREPKPGSEPMRPAEPASGSVPGK